jgi:hypothetical protein
VSKPQASSTESWLLPLTGPMSRMSTNVSQS